MTATTLLGWLPGIGLLLLNGFVQAGAVVIAVIFLAASQITWLLPVIARLGQMAGGQVVGFPSWLLPAEWSSVGLILFIGQLSLWLAVLYLAWLIFSLRYQWRPRTKAQGI